MGKRSLVLMVVFTWLTAGLYLIYWTCSTQNRLKAKTGMGYGGLGHFFAIVFTFGLYYIAWSISIGERLEKVGGKDRGWLYYLVCSMYVIFPWVVQGQINDLK